MHWPVSHNSLPAEEAVGHVSHPDAPAIMPDPAAEPGVTLTTTMPI